MTTIKEKIKNMFEELGACAVEQGYSIKMEGKIYLDLIDIILFKKIIQEEFKVNDKTFWEVIHNGR